MGELMLYLKSGYVYGADVGCGFPPDRTGSLAPDRAVVPSGPRFNGNESTWTPVSRVKFL